MKKRVINFINNNKVELIVLGIILLVGAIFRLYKISEYMTFLGDEGRDVIIVRRIFTELHPPLIGPGTSVGGMYLGPLYYYFMAIPLALAGFSPVGPAVMIAVLGLITIAFVWWVGRLWFDKKVGLIAAGLYAISPTVIYFSRSSWNPNIMPFFAFLCVYSIWEVWKRNKFNWLIVLGISFAFVLQSHYLGLLLAPTLFLFWIITLRNLRLIRNSKFEILNFMQKSFFGFLIFSVLMSPLLIFDIRHNYINSKAISSFFTNSDNSFSFKISNIFSSIPDIFNQINNSLVGGKNIFTGYVVSIMLAVVLIIFLVKTLKSKKISIFRKKPELTLIVFWLLLGILGLSIYQKAIYDHYLGFLFVTPYILVSILISKLISGNIIYKVLGYIFLFLLIIVNLNNNPLRKQPNRLLARSVHIAEVIENNSNGEPFNLAVIADNNYEAAYEYFLLKDRYPVIKIDPQIPSTTTDQLFVVCELIPNSKCDPTHSPKAQVASFGWSKIDSTWEVDGAMVYKLVHSI